MLWLSDAEQAEHWGRDWGTMRMFQWQWLFAGLCLVLTGCASTGPSVQTDGLTVKNLKVGLVCWNNGVPTICTEATEIKITNSGLCVFNKRTVPCTWYGFAFDYSTGEKSAKIQCQVESSAPVNWGNPREALKENATTSSYEIELRGDQHYFINPQYSAAGSARLGTVSDVQTCSYKGTKLFQIELALEYPTP